ncbi:MAG: hypothetical protein R3F21_01265 [Myxococcota bacterium]
MKARVHRKGKRVSGGIGLASLLCAAAIGCGPEEGKRDRVASMVAPVAETAGDSAADGAPRIESVSLDPARPIAGARIRARARLDNAGGRNAAVDYRWRTSSGRELGQGPDFDTAGLEPGTVLELVATPSRGEEVGEEFVHRVQLAAEASQIALVVIDAPEGASVGSRLRAVVETTDEEGGFDQALLEWRVDGEVVGTEAELETAPFQPGNVVELRAWPADAQAESGRRGRPIHAEPIALQPSRPPEIVSEPSSGLEGGLFRYAVRASSPAPGATLRFEIRKGPEGMKVDPATGVVEWRPSPEQRGRFEVEVAVFDQWGSGVAQAFAIGAESSESPPAAPR